MSNFCLKTIVPLLVLVLGFGSNSLWSEGKLVFDLGFRPQNNGFGFANYGDEAGVQNLTPVEMVRMFGDAVISQKKGNKIILSPPAKQWMEQTNAEMSAGHCEGMAVLSLLFYQGKLAPKSFGGTKTTDLKLANANLQHEIAYWWATQCVDAIPEKTISDTPAQLLNVLKKASKSGESFSIGLWKRDLTGGHAITPYAIEDRGRGQYSIKVYDNNYPGDERDLLIDTKKNTWSYEASINPEVEPETYDGDADTLTLVLTPTSARFGVMTAPFLAPDGETTDATNLSGALASKKSQAKNPRKAFNEIFLEGQGHVLITDDAKRRLGWVNGKFVHEIPGAEWRFYKNATSLESPEPSYKIPDGVKVKIVLDGSDLKKSSPSDLVIIGPGYVYGVEGIELDPKQKDIVEFDPSDDTLTYTTSGTESPNLTVGLDNLAGADYTFDLKGTSMKKGGSISIKVDAKKGDLVVDAKKLGGDGEFDLYLERVTTTDEDDFSAVDLALPKGSAMYINFVDWKGNGKGLSVGIDSTGSGEIDTEYTAEDSE
jgi:hypothetical protein